MKWLNLEEGYIDLYEYLKATMDGVLFRQLSNLLGLKIQVSLAQDQLIGLITNSAIPQILSQKISEVEQLFKNTQLEAIFKLFKSFIPIKDPLQDITNFHRQLEDNKQIASQILADQLYLDLIKTNEKLYLFFDCQLDEKEIKKQIQGLIEEWKNHPQRTPELLLQVIQQKWFQILEMPSFIADIFEEKIPSASKYSGDELKRIFRLFLCEDPENVGVLIQRLRLWDDKIPHTYYKSIKDQFTIQDLSRCNLLVHSSYIQATLDAVVSFEEWVTFYISCLVRTDPTRFLNNKGIHGRFREEMNSIKTAFEIDTSEYTQMIDQLVQLERWIIGYKGKGLEGYFVKHVKVESFNNSTKELFKKYIDIRKLRDDIVHPDAIDKSSLHIPGTISEFETIISDLKDLGQHIIRSCNFKRYKTKRKN